MAETPSPSLLDPAAAATIASDESKAEALFTDAVERVCKWADIDRHQFGKLLQKDDWEFVLKVSAFFEIIFAKILSLKIEAPKLESAFRRLPMGEQDYGKVKFLQALEIIGSGQANFLRRLASLRNECAHTVAHDGFNLSETIRVRLSALTRAKRDQLICELCCVKDPAHLFDLGADLKLSATQLLERAPKLAIVMGSLQVLLGIAIEDHKLQTKKDEEALARQELALARTEAALGRDAWALLEETFAKPT